MSMHEFGGMFIRVIWMYIFQLPGTVILWLFRDRKSSLKKIYEKNGSISGIIGLGVILLLFLIIFKF